jgi:hypothetical protein
MKLNFDLRGFETVYELSFTKRLFNTMEEQLKEVHEKTIKELKEESDIEDEEDYMIFCSTVTGFENNFEDEQIAVRSSHLIRLYSLFEIHAQKLCEAVAKEKKLELRLRDFSSKEGMVKGIKLFLAKYAKVIPFDHRTWHELNNLRVIRNHLVHDANSRWSPNGATKLDKISQNEPKLPIIEDGKFTLPKEACDHLHTVVTDFFKLGFKALGWLSFHN